MLERVRLGGFSGTYRIRSAELARDRKLRTINVSVLFLDDSTHTFHIEKRSKGSELLDLVFQHLELSERDYFGLQFKKSAADVIVSVDCLFVSIKFTNVISSFLAMVRPK